MLACLLAVSATIACQPDAARFACDADALEAGILERVESIDDYRLRTMVSIDSAEAFADIVGRSADRLRIRIELPDGLAQTAVFDGSYQWVESSRNGVFEVLRVTLAESATTDRPFDTGYYLQGSGLLSGEDFPQTVRTLLSLYELDAYCDTDATAILRGAVNEAAVGTYATGRNADSGARFAERFPYLRLHIDREDFAVMSYTLGTEASPVIRIDFMSQRLNVGVSDREFDYEPPAGVEPVDITAAILEQRRPQP